MMLPRRLVRFTLLLLLLFAALPALDAAPRVAEGQVANPVASLEPVQGTIQVRRANAAENDWITLTATDLVEQGDYIRTDDVGLAILTFFEGVQSEVLANTILRVEEFQATPAADGSTANYQVTLELAVGAMHQQINQALDPQSHFEMYTPSAFIAVRGTNFWTASTPEGESWIKTLDGVVQTNLVLSGGQMGGSALVPAGNAINTFPDGTASDVGPITSLPQYPPRAALAPATCGDGICQAGEETVCSLDCRALLTCGDGTCQEDQGEGPATCAQDCIPPFFRWEDTLQSQTNTVPQTPCTIVAPNANVAMRVGPGFNRGIRDYLPANQPYTVIGKATATDGSLWWRIDVPNVPEAWVLQTDVTQSGACELVPDASAPPIVLPPPPQPTATEPGQPPVQTEPKPLSVSFVANPTSVGYGQCATVRWDVEGIDKVYYEGVGVTGHESRQECPYETTTYQLTVLTLDGQTLTYTVTVTVDYGTTIN